MTDFPSTGLPQARLAETPEVVEPVTYREVPETVTYREVPETVVPPLAVIPEEPERRGLLKSIFGGGSRSFGMIFALVALILIFQFLTINANEGSFFANIGYRLTHFTNGLVLTPMNVQNIINGNSFILIMAFGMVMVIIAGHIDLSVGSVAAAVGIIVAMAIRDWGIPWWAGILLGLACGAIIGAWQGFWVAYVGIPGFITTLAGMMLFRGLNQQIGNANTIPVPEQIRFLGSGHLPDWGPVWGIGTNVMNNSTILLGVLGILGVIYSEIRRRAAAAAMDEYYPAIRSIVRVVGLSLVIAFLAYLFGGGRAGTSFPISGVILLGLCAIYWFLTTRTVLGRNVYAVGGNKHAAELSGVNIQRTNFFVMMNMSVLAAVAAIVFIGRAQASGPSDGVGWELDVIAAVFIGGTAVSGGVGTVTGALIGGLVMAVLNNGLQLLPWVGSSLIQIIKGFVLLAAVAFDVYNKVQGRTSIIGRLTGAFRRGDAVPPEKVIVEKAG